MSSRLMTRFGLLSCFTVLFTASLALFSSSARAQEFRLQTQVLGQNSWLVKSAASLRVIVKDHSTDTPVAGAKVLIELTPTLDANGKPKGSFGPSGRLYDGQTGADGSLDAAFTVPNFDPGGYGVQITVNALGETDVVNRPLSLKRSANLLITTDKPLYQPGQTIHVRALALQPPSLSPLSGAPLTLEVSDGKGNKVFKKLLTTSDYGVAAADFILADEVNLGSYRVRAETPAGSVEKTVTVDRYVLPKFKVAPHTDRSFYAPGSTLTANVKADYFFGKPVAGAVKVVLSRFDVGFNDFATVEGALDANGYFQFSQKLPEFFAGIPLQQGNAFVKMETTVTDTAGHSEQVVTTVPVALDGVRLTVLPESGEIAVGVPNRLYLVTSAPDGSPLAATVTVKVANGLTMNGSTDAAGLGAVTFTPTETTLSLTASARDASGNGGTWKGDFYSATSDSLLLRADQALCTVGQTAHLTVLSSAKAGTVYFDGVRGGQTVFTDTAELADGRASLDVPLDPNTVGTLEVNAYRLTSAGQMVRDTRILLVNPANDLKIAMTGDAATYLPGGKAKLNFKVTNAAGAGVAAALGVNIVDESVFALQAMQPGMEKVFFLLEKEILQPRYEIHGIDTDSVVTPQPTPLPPAREGDRQLAAQALFAQVPPLYPYTLNVDTFTQKVQLMQDGWSVRILTDGGKMVAALNAFNALYRRYPTAKEGVSALVTKRLLPAIPKDPWGGTYTFTPYGAHFGLGFGMSSGGADRKTGTQDDQYASWSPGGKMTLGGRYLTMRGDADQNAAVNVKDAVLILRAAVRLDTPDPTLTDTYDANADALITVADAIRVLKIAAGLAQPLVALSADPIKGGGGCDVCDVGGPPRNNDGGPMPPAPQPGEGGGASENQTTGAGDVRVRQFFPETLYSNPAVITDGSGNAALDVDIADSITTWRVSTLANSMNGALGSADAPLRVFQDFFVDLDFPVQLTQGDEVNVPVAVYNYLPTPQTVTLTANPGDGFDLLDSDTQTVTLAANEVKGARFRVRAKTLGSQAFEVKAVGATLADAVRREVRVVPNGKRVENSVSGRLSTSTEQTLHLPDNGIPGSYGLLVKVYPGLFSQLVEGMDAIFQMPYGCFEQTTSTTYPNVLALAYLKKTGKAAPETQLKAEGYINLGYQRLVTFEVPGGGFEWFGQAPANQVLTAYGLLEFADMAKVYAVDPALISRTAQWLAAKQQPEGTWKPDPSYLSDGVWNNLDKTDLPVTAYAVWALAESGYTGPALPLGVEAVKRLWPTTSNVYFLGLAANALAAAGSSDADPLLQKLVDERQTTDDGLVYWKSGSQTLSFSRGDTAAVETTAYITYALVRSGKYGDVASKALGWLVKQKDPQGTWGNTQATVMALKALIASMEAAAHAGDRHLTLTVNGVKKAEWDITADNADVMKTVDAADLARPGDNLVRLDVTGEGQSMFQLSGWGYLGWDQVPVEPGGPASPLSLSVSYDRTELDVNGEITATAKVAWKGPGAAQMVVVDLGIPPGFEVNAEDFNQLVEKKTLQKYSLTGRQVICYLDRVGAAPVTWSWRLKAKYPLKAQTPQSRAYTYYNPEVQSVAAPQALLVR